MKTISERYLPLHSPDDPAAPAPASASDPPAAAGSPSPDSPPGGGAAPSDAPVESSTANVFEALGQPMDDDGDVVTIQTDATPAPAAPPVAEATPPKPGAPAPQAPGQVPPKPAAVQPTPAPQAQPSAQPPKAAQPSAPEGPKGLVEQLTPHKKEIIAGLAAQRFALSREEAEALNSDPAGTVPQLAARVYFDAVESTLLHIQNYVPQMVVSLVNAMNEQKKAEDAFYGKYTGLDRTKHQQDILAFANAFKAQNPQIGQDDLLAMIAAAVAGKHGLQPIAAPAPQPPGGPPRQPQVPAFVPAKPGATVRVTPETPNAFMGLGGSYDDDGA